MCDCRASKILKEKIRKRFGMQMVVSIKDIKTYLGMIMRYPKQDRMPMINELIDEKFLKKVNTKDVIID